MTETNAARVTDAPAVPPTDAPTDTPAAPESVHCYLYRHGVLARVINNALSKAGIPTHLRDDARQEICLELYRRQASPPRTDVPLQDQVNQVAGYATSIGYHTAIRQWRNLGPPVRLPGSAFRKRDDGSTLVQPGHLAEPTSADDYEDMMGPAEPDESISSLAGTAFFT